MVGKSEGKKPLERHGGREYDNIKMYLKSKITRCGMDSSGLKLGQVTGINRPNPVHKNTYNFLTV